MVGESKIIFVHQVNLLPVFLASLFGILVLPMISSFVALWYLGFTMFSCEMAAGVLCSVRV